MKLFKLVPLIILKSCLRELVLYKCICLHANHMQSEGAFNTCFYWFSWGAWGKQTLTLKTTGFRHITCAHYFIVEPINFFEHFCYHQECWSTIWLKISPGLLYNVKADYWGMSLVINKLKTRLGNTSLKFPWSPAIPKITLPIWSFVTGVTLTDHWMV
jgi:hypothetical protein